MGKSRNVTIGECLQLVKLVKSKQNSSVLLLVSWGALCYNKVPKTEWLRTTGISCLTALEARSLRQGVSRALLPLYPIGEDLSLSLAGSRIPRCSLASPRPSHGLLPVSLPSVHGCLCGHISLFYKDTVMLD